MGRRARRFPSVKASAPGVDRSRTYGERLGCGRWVEVRGAVAGSDIASGM
jgi:hypothetical protein